MSIRLLMKVKVKFSKKLERGSRIWGSVVIRLVMNLKVKFKIKFERGSRSRGEREHKIASESERTIFKKVEERQ